MPTATASPSSTSATFVIGERHMAFRCVGRQRRPGDFGHEVLWDVLEVRLYSGRVDRRVMSQVGEIQRISSEMRLKESRFDQFPLRAPKFLVLTLSFSELSSSRRTSSLRAS